MQEILVCFMFLSNIFKSFCVVSGGMDIKMKKLLEKYKDIIPYAMFGILTTFVNIVSYWICARLLKSSVTVATVIAWIFAVLFAYVTNRNWVFHSEAEEVGAVVKEMAYFFVCRLATGIVDWLCMFVFADKLKLNDVVIKTLANIFVIILNYAASKIVIFKHERG